MISCYSNALSAMPGDIVGLKISSSGANCALEVARLGLDRHVVFTRSDIPVSPQPVPSRADEFGCDWSETVRVEIGGSWPSGYYEIIVRNEAGEAWHHFVCVLSPRSLNRTLLVLATNTYQAYNWWGGRSTYADIQAVVEKRQTMLEALEHATGIVCQSRPFAQGIVNSPDGVPKLMNGNIRPIGELPSMPSREFAARHGLGPLDGPAGFKNKWEHKFVQWCEARGIGLDYATDRDLDERPGLLDGYACVVVAGHSEYWSGPQRHSLDAFVDNGGNLAVFSGNTSYWKVRWEGDRMICHKSRGLTAEPDLGVDATGLWSHPQFGKPEAELIGLSFLLGGYHRIGLCVARGSASYTVYDDTHWALSGADLFYGDQIGFEPPLLAYENDGCLIQFDSQGRIRAVPHLGVPGHLEVIAIAPAAFAEDPTKGYPPLLAPEKLELAAQVVFGAGDSNSQDRLRRGHAVMASFRRGKGEVFNGGTTEWVTSLFAGDPFIERITWNVLTRFGAISKSQI